MKLKPADKQRRTRVKPQWPAMIRARRLELGESQPVFGARFGVTNAAVSLWESGKNDPPSEVTWWLYKGGK